MCTPLLRNATHMVHCLQEQFVQPGDQVVDATLGHGHDSQKLLSLIGPSGYLYGFDIQEEAIVSTRQRLSALGYVHFELFHTSHVHIKDRVPVQVDHVVFNLGYLPGADKSITTSVDATLEALTSAFERLKVKGMIWLTIYPGHASGQEEARRLGQVLPRVDQRVADVLQLSFINQRNHPPYTCVIQKKKEGILFHEIISC